MRLQRRSVALLLAMVFCCGLTAQAIAEPSDTPAPLEPPDGRMYHGTSPSPLDVDPYVVSLGDTSVRPAVEGMHGGVPGTRLENMDRNTRDYLARLRNAGRIPHLSYSMSIGEGQAVDDVIAQSDTYDEQIRIVGRAIRDYGDPVFVRIGFEFNGSWNNYHPGQYPVAFRKFVDLLRAEGADNIVTIWCYEPDAPDDFDAVGTDGQPLWYPGDKYVDWFGIDLFNSRHFVPGGDREEPGPYQRTLRFLDMARQRGKPVFLSELAAVDAHITPDSQDPGFVDGQADWAKWFEPFFAFLEAHPEIKGFNYMSQDYRGTQYEVHGWGNSRIQDNSYIKERWVEQLRDPRFIHAAPPADQTQPTTTFAAAPPVLSSVAGQKLTGTATDDLSGVDRLFITYTHTVTAAVTSIEAVLSCDSSRKSCTFSADPPGPGMWDANARSQDRAGNHEAPGPTLSDVVAIP